MAAIISTQTDSGVAVALRRSKYLNNIGEQDNRAVKRVTQPMLGFKTFRQARIVIGGIEATPIIRNG